MTLLDRRLVALATVATLAGAPAMAQTPGPAQPGQSPPNATSNGNVPKGGVILPPGQVDPEIKRPAPTPSQAYPTMVIPPPGTPGGNPNVIAK